MRRTLPSVRALESFEAVARYGNVTRAAEELGRTQSAVSRQIANLEAFARRKLFIRNRKQLTLNEVGRNYCKKIVSLLDALEAETVKLVAFGAENQALRLAVSPTFASRWLMPRLAGFAGLGGFAELQLSKGPAHMDFDRQQLDAAIECAYSEPVGVICHRLLDEEIVAVISPRLYHERKKRVFDRLLLPESFETWKTWSEKRGAPPFTEFSLKFEDHSLMIEASALGFGVAIVPTIYVTHELSSGRLIAPFGEPMASGRTYWLAYPEQSLQKQKVVKFARWLTANNPPEPRAGEVHTPSLSEPEPERASLSIQKNHNLS